MNTDTQVRRTLGRKYYPQTTIQLLLAEVEKGRTVVQICEDPQFPAASSFYAWCASDPALQDRYQAARKTGEAARTTNV